MARLEDLITNIPDSGLRSAIDEEILRLKNATDFGLVFERHEPETVCLPASIGIREGDRVCIRTEPTSRLLRTVKKLTSKTATVVDSEGVESRHPLKDVLVVKGFGEPIFPSLKTDGAIKRSKDRPPHIVIEGENFHALELLALSHAGRVDAIYIDPPYNTGARDWKYNNDYVDENDRYASSKWLSMMERRLALAKRLLKPDGVLVVTIDEHEVHHLAMLLESMFREYYRHMVNIVINPKGTNKTNFGRVEEHAFFVVPISAGERIAHLPPPADTPEAGLIAAADAEEDDTDSSWVRAVTADGDVRLPRSLREQLGVGDEPGQASFELKDDFAELRVELEDVDDEDEAEEEVDEDTESVLFLRRRGAESSYRHQRPNQFYGIWIDEKKKAATGVGPALTKGQKYALGQKKGNAILVFPIDEEGNERVWRYKRETMLDYIESNQIRVGTHWPERKQPYTLNHVKVREGERLQRIRTTWWRKSHDAGTHGTTLLSRLLGAPNPFPFPKSLYAVQDALDAVVRDRKDAVIVDFFAGSGTTLHATALLNERDGGGRQCIMVTNNEVDEARAKVLHSGGEDGKQKPVFFGDAEFEKHGIFEATTRPRTTAAITGVRPDGTKIPSGTKYRYIGGKPWSEGFDENVEFMRLSYLDPNRIELGEEWASLLPALWLMSGAEGPRPSKLNAKAGFQVFVGSGFAILFDEEALPKLISKISEDDSVREIFLITSSEESYAEMTAALPTRRTHMLPRDYLRFFRQIARQRI